MLLSLYLYLVHTRPHGKYHFLSDVDDVLETYHKYAYGKPVWREMVNNLIAIKNPEQLPLT